MDIPEVRLENFASGGSSDLSQNYGLVWDYNLINSGGGESFRGGGGGANAPLHPLLNEALHTCMTTQHDNTNVE